MEVTMNKYIYEHEGEELSVLCQIALPKTIHFEKAKNEVIKKYGSCDESKLIFKKSIIITGYVDDDKFVEGR